MESYKIAFPYSLLTADNDNVFYIKQGSDYVIGFAVSMSFFHRCDFVYFSSEKAYELIEEKNRYDSIQELDGQKWAYVKWY